MEDSVVQKRKHQKFALASVSELCCSVPSSSAASPGIARFAGGDGSSPELQIRRESQQIALNVDLRAAQVCFSFIIFFFIQLLFVWVSVSGKKKT